MVLLFIAELAFAFIIAGIVANFLEINAKREQIEYFRYAQEFIQKSVFEAVFKIKHSEEYVRSVIGNCFESPLHREDYKITYEVECFSEAEAAHYDIDRDAYVKVIVTASYKARNMGPDHQSFPTAYGIPYRPGKLADITGMKKLKVGDKKFKPEAIVKFEQTIVGSGHSSEKVYEFDVPTDPGEYTDVALEVHLIKELSDNDAFGFRRPTVGSTIRFINRTEHILDFGVTPRSSAMLRETRPQSQRSGEWEIIGPILPFDSVILWWRKPHPGDAETIPETQRSRMPLEIPSEESDGTQDRQATDSKESDDGDSEKDVSL